MDFGQYNKRWLALQVRPRYEFIAASILRSKGYEEFLPVYTVKRKWSDRTKKIVAPLFSGYVFCRMDSSINFPMVTTPGVIRIVGTRRGIGFIEDEEIETIRMAERSGREVEPWTYFQVGDRVQINEGPLTGLQGILVACRNKRRLVVSVSLIQSSMAIEVGEESLTLVRSHQIVSGSNPSLAPEASPGSVPSARLMNLPAAVVA
ncbi:MAG TPA: UpxY family transcription antiterminator [Candidatus Angelobacter sp.]|jgi:transcription antitermination factor NusG|nr:UpxY family transcription antiterminator [Candidatus Angelobacter sp.]